MRKLMDLNKETASRLWVKQFGKKQKAIDFAGREIAKAAYNDRNSNYGWNVDHILPLTQRNSRLKSVRITMRLWQELLTKRRKIEVT